WVLPGQGRALGLWRAQDPDEMQAILESLPLYAWMTAQTTPLTAHSSDPALANRLKIVRPLGPCSLGVDLRPGQRPSRRAGQLRGGGAAWPARDVSEHLLRDPAASSDSEPVPARAQASEAPGYTKCNRPLAWGGVPSH